MNWLTILAVLLLTFQNDVVLSTSTKSLWSDPDKASSTIDCLITKIGESENFPQEVKDELESIMDTLMSGIRGINTKGKNSGPRIQAMNMAIASSLAEIVVTGDDENPKDIALKAQDLVGGLEQCFESVMGTIDKKFIGEINDLIAMFAKEAASEIEDVKDQEDPSSSPSTETANKSTAQPSLSEDGDQVPESKPIEDGTEDPEKAPSDVNPLSSRPQPHGVEPQDSQTTPEIIAETTNEQLNASISTVGLKKGIPDQIIRTSVYPNSALSSSYHSTSQSSANTHQSSDIIQGFSETARSVLSTNRRLEYFEPLATASKPEASKSTQNEFGPQVSLKGPGFVSREAKKLVGGPTWRVFQGNEVPQKTVSIFGNPNRLHSLSIDTTSQFVDILKPISTPQESSQKERGYEGTYSGDQLSKPSPIDVELGTSHAEPGIISKTVNKQGDTSTLKVVDEQEDTSTRGVVNEQDYTSTRGVVNEQEDSSQRSGVVLRSGVLQETKPTTADIKGSSSLPQATSRSAVNTNQSNQTFKDRRYRIRNRRPDFFKPSPIAAGPQMSTQNDVGFEIALPASGHIGTVGNELTDTSTRIGSTNSRLPQQTGHQSRSSSSSYETTRQSAFNSYQSSHAYQGSSQISGGYARKNHRHEFPEHPAIAAGLQTPNFVPNNVDLQALREQPGFIPRETDKLEDTSTRRVFMRNGVPQQIFPSAGFLHTPSSSFSKTSQLSDNSNESSQLTQSSNLRARGNGGIIHKTDQSPIIASGSQVSKPTQNNFGHQVLPEATGLITGVADELTDTTRKTGLRNGVPQQTAYSNKSSYQGSQSDDKSYQSSQAFQGSIQTTDGYRRRYHKPQTTAIDVGSMVLYPAPGLVSGVLNGQGNTSTLRVVNDQGDTSTQRGVNNQGDTSTQRVIDDQGNTSTQRVVNDLGDRLSHTIFNDQGDTSTLRVSNDQADASTQIGVVLRDGANHQTVSTAQYPKRQFSSSFQTSQLASNNYQSSQAFQGSIQTTDGYRRRYYKPQFLETTEIDVGSMALQAVPGPVSRVVNGQGDTSTLRVVNAQGDTSIQGVVNDQGDTSTQRVDNDQGARSTQAVVNDQGDTSTQRVVKEQGDTSRQGVVNDQGDTSTQRIVKDQGDTSTQTVVNDQGDTSTLRVANDQADASTHIRAVLRDGSRAKYLYRPFSPSFKTSQSASNTYQSSQTFQGSSQNTGGSTFSGSQLSQSARIGNGPQIPQAALGLASSSGSQDASNERSYNQQWRELSVIPTLNSPIGLRSDSAAARISQMISAVLNTVGPNGIDVNALSRNLQDSVLNIKSSGMSSSDAKMEVLLELVVGLLQIVSSAQVREINTDASAAVTNSAARCFELGLA